MKHVSSLPHDTTSLLKPVTAGLIYGLLLVSMIDDDDVLVLNNSLLQGTCRCRVCVLLRGALRLARANAVDDDDDIGCKHDKVRMRAETSTDILRGVLRGCCRKNGNMVRVGVELFIDLTLVMMPMSHEYEGMMCRCRPTL